MGGCCSGDANRNETNLSRKGELNTVPLAMVIKAQALMRGMLARKRVKRAYGFEISTGLFHRRGGTNLVEMDPVKLEEQRQKVQDIRKQLPSFEYGLDEQEDNEPYIHKESREMTVLPDNAKYEGQWNVATNERHGQGY